MATEIHTSITIKSTPEKVWAVFTNFQAYPDWNPSIKSLNGEVKVGEKIEVALEGMKFKPKVLVFEKNKELEWLGHLLFPGLFDGKHRFLIIERGNGTITFEQSEKFRGILVPLLRKKLMTDVKAKFEEMNSALKEKVEHLT